MAKKREKTSSNKAKLGLKATIAEAEVGKGKVSVSASVSVSDLSPVSAGISLNDENELSVKSEIKVPGAVVGVGGGVVIDLDTGEVKGGSGSLSAAGATIEISQFECEKAISVSYFAVTASYSENVCDDDDDDDNNGDDDDDDDGNNPYDPNDFPTTPHILIFTRPGRKILSAPSSVIRILNPNVLTEPVIASREIQGGYFETGIYFSYSELQQVISGTIMPAGSPVGTTNWGFFSEIFDDPIPKFPQWRFHVAYTTRLGSSWRVTGGQFASEDLTVTWNSIDISFSPIECIYSSNPREFIKVFNYLAFGGRGKLVTGANLGSFFFRQHFGGDQKVARMIPVTLGQELRRPIPSGKNNNMNECCDASISLLRKIAKVLAVDRMLAMKTSGTILKGLEEGIDAVLAEPNLQIEMDNYLDLNTFLSLLSNRKVAVAVGVDQLEFEEGEKNPIFNYLRWLSDYSKGLTPLEYKAWLIDKKEGLEASKTQFKSLIDLINAELNNSKNVSEVLRANDLKRGGMKVPNELFVPEGTGSTVVYDYMNIFKKIIQILDLNTVSPFTAVLKDSDPAKEGDQTMTKFYPDATSACKEIVELLLENKIDSATRLNILIRQSVLATQQQVALLETLSITYTIMYGLGLPYSQKGSHFVAPFDISPDSPKDEADKQRLDGRSRKYFSSWPCKN